jgi:hypothetical protein
LIALTRTAFRAQAYEFNTEQESDKFSSTQREHENYVKLLQGLVARSVRLYASHNRQNALLFQLHGCLQRLRESDQRVHAECGKLRSQLAAAKHAKDGKPSSVVEQGSPIMVVHLEKANVDVVLQEDMCVFTPMGNGEISQILAEPNKVEIKLPYGVMYAHLPRVAGWIHTAQRISDARGVLAAADSVHGVQQRFQDSLYERLSMPAADAAAIQAFLAQQQRGEEDAGALTDHDEASDDGSEALDGSSNPASLPETTAPPSQSQQDSSEMEVAEGENEDEGGHHLRSGPARSSALTASADKDASRQRFPLQVPATAGRGARVAAKKALEAEVLHNYPQVLLDSLPIAFAPACKSTCECFLTVVYRAETLLHCYLSLATTRLGRAPLLSRFL